MASDLVKATREEREAAGYVSPFSPTRPHTVDALLADLGLDEDAVLLDLGCGDGRFCIRAVEQFGCRAVGVDLDPALIEKAHAVAAASEHAEAVRARCELTVGDLRETDWTVGTHIVFFLLPGCLPMFRDQFIERIRAGVPVASVQWPIPEMDKVDGVAVRKCKCKAWFYYIYTKA